MGDEAGRPPLVRRVPGATRAGPADPDRRAPPELPEEFRQRIQAVVNAAHAQAEREGQAQDQEEIKGKSAGSPGRPGSPKLHVGLRAVLATSSRRVQERLSDEDAEFDTAPLPRMTTSGAIAGTTVNGQQSNGAVKPGHAVEEERAGRPLRAHPSGRDRTQDKRRDTQDKRRARQERAAQRKGGAPQPRAGRQEHERPAEEHAERAAQLERERAAAEERAALEHARQEKHRIAAEERARLEQERAAQLERERTAAEGRARQAQERATRREQKYAAKRDRTTLRERAAQQKRAAREELTRALQEHARQEREGFLQEHEKRERARLEEERAAQVRARQDEEQERIHREQELEDREWAARKRARQERERAEEESARRRKELEQESGNAPKHGRTSQPGTPFRAEHLERTPPPVSAPPPEPTPAPEPTPQADHAAQPPVSAAPSEPTPAPEPEPTPQADRTAQPAQRRTATVPPAPKKEAAPPPSPDQPTLSGRQKTPSRRGYRKGALVATAAVFMAAGWLVYKASTHPPAHTVTRLPKLTPAQIAKVTRNEAAAWVSQQVNSTATVSCDPLMCQALRTHGVEHLSVLQPKATDPGGSIVVATAAIRHQFGNSLVTNYAPAVIASFGTGDSRIDIRQTVPGGARAFQAALRADQQTRKEVEPTLANSLQVVASPAARRQLDDGQVDARLGELIVGMAGYLSQPVHILSFGDLGPGAATGIPLRSATLLGSPKTLRATLAFAQAQTGTFHPTRSELTMLDGRHVLIVEFSAPIPLGVLNQTS